MDSNYVKLSNSEKGLFYRVVKLNDEKIALRLTQLGFHESSLVMLKRKAPIFKDPLLFQVGESQIALTRKEAETIDVLEVQGEHYHE
tara:strand:+ start:36314 stop:36574 length:261 start_codon:yes stop_codon:yes gene_type:complete